MNLLAFILQSAFAFTIGDSLALRNTSKTNMYPYLGDKMCLWGGGGGLYPGVKCPPHSNNVIPVLFNNQMVHPDPFRTNLILFNINLLLKNANNMLYELSTSPWGKVSPLYNMLLLKQWILVPFIEIY